MAWGQGLAVGERGPGGPPRAGTSDAVRILGSPAGGCSWPRVLLMPKAAEEGGRRVGTTRHPQAGQRGVHAPTLIPAERHQGFGQPPPQPQTHQPLFCPGHAPVSSACPKIHSHPQPGDEGSVQGPGPGAGHAGGGLGAGGSSPLQGWGLGTGGSLWSVSIGVEPPGTPAPVLKRWMLVREVREAEGGGEGGVPCPSCAAQTGCTNW